MRFQRANLIYLLISFLGAWAFWEIPIQLGMQPTDPQFQFIALPGTFAPAVAAFVVRKWVTREGFADVGWWPRLSEWRSYLVVWLLPYGVVTWIILVAVSTGLEVPDFQMLRAIEAYTGDLVEPLPDPIRLLIPVQLAFTALLSTPILFGEEFGWRGYLQPRLSKKRPELGAIVTGIIWGLWHLPLNLRGYNFPAHPLLGMLLFTVNTIWLSVIFEWVRKRTGSIWGPCLAHAATNSIGGSLTFLFFFGSDSWLLISYLGLLAWVPLGGFAMWILLRGKLR